MSLRVCGITSGERGLVETLETLLETKGIGTGKLDDVGAMGEAIQESGGKGFGPKDLNPIGKLEIGVDDKWDMVVKGRAELKEQLSAAG